jgi:Zn-dependent protease with chaperone function
MMVFHDIRRASSPSLFIAERMFRAFSREELSAAVFHEIGHLRGVPLVLLSLASIFSVPMNSILYCVGELRMQLPAHWNTSVRTLYGIERGLHYVSMFAVHHADEYVADMCAVESQNTTEHFIAVLARLSELHHAKNMEYLLLTQGRFTLDDESHRHSHPTPKDRIHRLRNLRTNTS